MDHRQLPRLSIAIAAAAGPSLLAYNVSPSSTFLNQALAMALWGWFVVVQPVPGGGSARGAGTLHAALALVLGSVLWSWSQSLPASLALSAAGLLLAAMVLLAAGTGVHAGDSPERAFGDFCVGWAVAGGLNVLIALAQVFAPDWPDGDWIARSGFPGRAVGNLRQPNHLSSLLLWSSIAVVALIELRRLGRTAGAALLAALVFAVVLTASRTGLVGVALLALWGVADRRLSRPVRLMLVAAPVVYAVAWLGMAEWSRLSQHVFGGEARLAESDISSSRFGIWANTLELIRRQPLAGVGFGEFNFAWTLTPFPHRPVALFDHAHNLPLQLAAELGLPLAAAVMLLLMVALGLAGWRAFSDGDEGEGADVGTGRRAAFVMVLMIGLHSMLEYPLWYAYFLLPAAWAWAFAVGEAVPNLRPQPPSKALAAGGLALIIGAIASVYDYASVTSIFSADEGAAPLAERIARGQRSVLFAHHADYAAATTDLGHGDLKPFERANHYLLDARLMMAWAKALDQHGETNAARFVAERLREFRNPAAEEFFAACDGVPKAALAAASAAASAPEPAASIPFQCVPSGRQPDWREFIRP